MDLKDLYRDVIVDHNRHPRNFGKLAPADAHADGFNPLCGDKLSIYVNLDGDRIAETRFEGSGCVNVECVMFSGLRIFSATY